MPVALIFAFAASLGLHVAALFGPEIELAVEPDAPLIVAELKPVPALPDQPELVPPASVEPESKPEKTAPAKHPAPRRKPAVSREATVPAAMAMINPDAAYGYAEETMGPPQAAAVVHEALPQTHETSTSAPAAPRLPPRGSIRFRVDRGDSNFEIGVAHQDWEFEDGRYRLYSVVETTGLVSLFRSLRIEMESLGRFSENGLQPEVFGVMREGRRAREKALFDWETMKLRVSDRPEQVLNPGAQDLLSFYYQLGFMEIPAGGTGSMSVATGKKYGLYRLENLGDEDIEIPLGVVRTRHLRAPGENSTELWLAYDYRLLPVKIRHVDNNGGTLVQVAVEIKFGQ